VERNLAGSIDMNVKEEPDANSEWAVWVIEPLTKDAETLIRWSKASFFVGCQKPTLKLFDGNVPFS
jgi:hypothetical protein